MNSSGKQYVSCEPLCIVILPPQPYALLAECTYSERCRMSNVRKDHDPKNESSVTFADILVLATILGLGIFAFLFYQRASDFLHDDVVYADFARSLLDHRFYGLGGRPETNMPPGLSAILASLFVIFGYSRVICLHAMAIFEALGFLASYALLRCRLPKLVAAAICILLMSSPIYFTLASQWLWPCFPYFLTTILALLAFEEYENASTLASKIIWGFFLSSMVAASLMLASAAMALLAGMVAVIAVTFRRDRRLGLIRLRRLLPVLLVGIAVQGIWMHRRSAPLEWPKLPGYPATYFQQLIVRNGNHPELGEATLGEIPARIARNLFGYSGLLTESVLRHDIAPHNISLAIVPVLLVVMGWTYSVWRTGGGLIEWYFAAHEVIFMLWPWGSSPRFFLPIAPLACLYVWEGLRAVRIVVATKPRIAGIVWLPFGVFLTGSAWLWLSRYWPAPSRGSELSVIAWSASVICAVWMAYTGRPLSFSMAASGTGKWLTTPFRHSRLSPLRLGLYASCGVVVLVLVGVGVAQQVGVARENLRTVDARVGWNADIESAQWIRTHTPSNSIVMARQEFIAHHYAERDIVWFAPISNPDVLMDGIVRHNVDYVIVIKHPWPFYFPDDDYCFDRLLAHHGDAFYLVFQNSNARIFQVEKLALSKRL